MRNPVLEVRKALGLTQKQMAAQLGCSLTSERRFEYSGTMPKVQAVRNNLNRLAKKAGYELSALESTERQ